MSDDKTKFEKYVGIAPGKAIIFFVFACILICLLVTGKINLSGFKFGFMDFDLTTPNTKTAYFNPSPTPAKSIITPTIVVNPEEIIKQIEGLPGELSSMLYWWKEVDQGSADGEIIDPSKYNDDDTCYGLAWNTNEYGYHHLIVFQREVSFTFADGGWFVIICFPEYIQISSESVGEIQVAWLAASYGGTEVPWAITIIE